MPREPAWWYRPGGLTSRALTPIARIFAAVAEARLASNAGYRSSLPVICVGNFTAGGSGKTPFTAMLAAHLIARGERPVVLTRGFGGRTVGPHWVAGDTDRAVMVGDEPLLLARVAPTLVARDRRAGACAIEDANTASVIVMDDGLQNPALIKDLSIAIVDGARGIGNACVIPAGPLRAPLAAQGRLVDLIVFNGPFEPPLAAALSRASPAPQLTATLVPAGDVVWLRGQRIVAFAGIGNPARFFDHLTRLGADLADAVAFPDHAPYRPADADRLLAIAARHRTRLITTEKDAVRLQGDPGLAVLCAVTATLPVRMELDADGLAALDRRLDRLLRR